MSDNLALGHEAHPDTQLPRSEVGLRVMHRSTIHGRVPPAKTYPWLTAASGQQSGKDEL